MRRIAVIALVGVVGIGLLLYVAWSRMEDGDAVAVTRADIVEEVLVSGTAQSGSSLEVKADGAGTVRAVKVSVGTKVKKGDALLDIVGPSRSQDKTIPTKELSTARTKLAHYEQALARDRALLAKIRNTSTRIPIPAQPPITTGLSSAEKEYNARLAAAYGGLNTARAKGEAHLVKEYDALKELITIAHIRANDATYVQSRDFFSGHILTLSFFGPYEQSRPNLEARRWEAGQAALSIQGVQSIIPHSSRATLDQSLGVTKRALETVRVYTTSMTRALDFANISPTTKELYRSRMLFGTSYIDDALAKIAERQGSIIYHKNLAARMIAEAEWHIHEVMRSRPSVWPMSPPPQQPVSTSVSTTSHAQIREIESRITSISRLIADQKNKITHLMTQMRTTTVAVAGAKGTVVSPADGIVVSVAVKSGDTFSSGMSLVTLTTDVKLVIEATVSADDARKVHPGNPALIRISDSTGEPLGGHVDRSEPIAKTDTHRVRILLDKADDRIKDGMRADVSILTQTRHNALILPESLLIKKEDGTYVRLIENGKANDVRITTGIRSKEGNVEIVQGVSEGQKVEKK